MEGRRCSTPRRVGSLLFALGIVVGLGGCTFFGGSRPAATPIPSPVGAPTGEVSPTPSPTPTPPTVGRMPLHKLGEAADVDGLKVSPQAIRRTSAGEPKPKEGYEYLAIEVSLENTVELEKLVALMSYSLQDDQGQRYSPVLLAGSSPPKGKVGPKGKIAGTLTFEVPLGAKGLKLIFGPGRAWDWWLLEP